MAVNLVTITGNLETLVGGTPYLGRLWFRLNRADWNGTGQIFAPEYIEATGDTVTGAFSVALQSTTDLEAGAYYSAILKYRDMLDGKDREYEVATFLVPTGGPYLLADLLNSPVAMPIPYTDHVYTYAEVEAWTTAFQPSYQYIIVNDGGYYVAYERDPTGASTDLVTAYGEAYIKRGVNADDFATLAADLATTLGPVYSTNANGSSVKFPDGTMICTKVLTGKGPISSASGSLFASSSIAIGALPATFIGVPIRHTMIASPTGAAAWHQDLTMPTATDGGNIGMLRATTSASTTYEVHCTFTGRWA